MEDKNRLGQMILSHWQEHWPHMVEELQKKNQLEQAIHETQERTGDFLYELLSVQKIDYHTAWEIATREWAFLPTADRLQPSSAHSSPSQNPKKPPPATSK